MHIPIKPLPEGCVTFIADDGLEADFSVMAPAFIAANVPACLALVSGTTIGCDWTNLPSLLAQQLDAQNRLGWEILSHSASHLNLAQLTEAQANAELAESKAKLTALGFRVRHFVYPFGGENPTVRRLTSKHYECAFLAGGAPATGVVPIPTFGMPRVPLGAYSGNATLESYKVHVDFAKTYKRWLTFMMHPANPEHTSEQQQHLVDVIAYAKSAGVPILTVSQAFERFSNLFEIGDALRVSADGRLYIIPQP